MFAVVALVQIKPLPADAKIQNDNIGLIEILYQTKEEIECNEKDLTVYDIYLNDYRRNFGKKKDSCEFPENICTAMFKEYLSKVIEK